MHINEVDGSFIESDAEFAAQAAKRVLLTEPGELYSDPDFGAGLLEYMSGTGNAQAIASVASKVTRSISPIMDVESVNVQFQGDQLFIRVNDGDTLLPAAGSGVDVTRDLIYRYAAVKDSAGFIASDFQSSSAAQFIESPEYVGDKYLAFAVRADADPLTAIYLTSAGALIDPPNEGYVNAVAEIKIRRPDSEFTNATTIIESDNLGDNLQVTLTSPMGVGGNIWSLCIEDANSRTVFTRLNSNMRRMDLVVTVPFSEIISDDITFGTIKGLLDDFTSPLISYETSYTGDADDDTLLVGLNWSTINSAKSDFSGGITPDPEYNGVRITLNIPRGAAGDGWKLTPASYSAPSGADTTDYFVFTIKPLRPLEIFVALPDVKANRTVGNLESALESFMRPPTQFLGAHIVAGRQINYDMSVALLPGSKPTDLFEIDDDDVPMWFPATEFMGGVSPESYAPDRNRINYFQMQRNEVEINGIDYVIWRSIDTINYLQGSNKTWQLV